MKRSWEILGAGSHRLYKLWVQELADGKPVLASRYFLCLIPVVLSVWNNVRNTSESVHSHIMITTTKAAIFRNQSLWDLTILASRFVMLDYLFGYLLAHGNLSGYLLAQVQLVHHQVNDILDPRYSSGLSFSRVSLCNVFVFLTHFIIYLVKIRLLCKVIAQCSLLSSVIWVIHVILYHKLGLSRYQIFTMRLLWPKEFTIMILSHSLKKF